MIEENKIKAHESQLVIAAAREDIKLFEQYKKMVVTEEFKAVIIEGFLQDYTTELFNELIQGGVKTDADTLAITRKMDGVKVLTSHIEDIGIKATTAVSRIDREEKFLATLDGEV